MRYNMECWRVNYRNNQGLDRLWHTQTIRDGAGFGTHDNLDHVEIGLGVGAGQHG